jgi:hypothetical protein
MTRPDRVDSIDLSLAFLPLATPVSDGQAPPWPSNAG